MYLMMIIYLINLLYKPHGLVHEYGLGFYLFLAVRHMINNYERKQNV